MVWAREIQNIPLKLTTASSTKDDDDDSTSISLLSTKQLSLNPSVDNTLLVLKFSDLLNPKHSHLVAAVELWNTPCQGENTNHYTKETGSSSSLSEKYDFETCFELLKENGSSWGKSTIIISTRLRFFVFHFCILPQKSKLYFLALSQKKKN